MLASLGNIKKKLYGQMEFLVCALLIFALNSTQENASVNYWLTKDFGLLTKSRVSFGTLQTIAD